jgi:translation initiation factor 2A
LNKKKQVTTSSAPDSTFLEWGPSGDIYVTATTSPRLRQGNGFKVWHYSGALLYELMYPEKYELLEVAWQKYSEGKFKEPTITSQKVEGIQSVQAQPSLKKYVPPHIREMGEAAIASYTSGAKNVSQTHGAIPGLPPGYTSSKQQQQKKTANKPAAEGDDDKKKASAIKKKLKDIKILKEKQQNGDKLDKNQLKKIDMEKELNKELAALNLS